VCNHRGGGAFISNQFGTGAEPQSAMHENMLLRTKEIEKIDNATFDTGYLNLYPLTGIDDRGVKAAQVSCQDATHRIDPWPL
jgi:hypothetical protein